MNRNWLTGINAYEPQTGKTEVLRPFVLAALYAAAIILIYLPAVFFEAALAGLPFGALLVGGSLALLFSVERVSDSGATGARRIFTLSIGTGRYIAVSLRPADNGRRVLAALAILAGGLFIYLHACGAWRWTWTLAEGRLWVGHPWGGTSIGPNWQGPRLALALALPVALIPAGVELLARVLMEIGAPNLANSIRAGAGVLLRRRWIGYRKADGEAAPEALQAAPPAVWG